MIGRLMYSQTHVNRTNKELNEKSGFQTCPVYIGCHIVGKKVNLGYEL